MLRAVKRIDAIQNPAAERLRRELDEATDYQLAMFLRARDGMDDYQLAGEIIRDFLGEVSAAACALLNEIAEEQR